MSEDGAYTLDQVSHSHKLIPISARFNRILRPITSRTYTSLFVLMGYDATRMARRS
jgi:hypothetical protein